METFLAAIEGVLVELISGFGMTAGVFDYDNDTDLIRDVDGGDELKLINARLFLDFISVLELRSGGV